ncbi:MAG: RNA pseudouridine synthase [Bacteroidales bacterium]|nr:RNA pseudouridine synthase [Bacteroidales bacterium]
MSVFHELIINDKQTALPEQFTCPFCYEPNPLAVEAASETMRYIDRRAEWRDELRSGKMFGVLVVHNAEGALGYLAAFSGNIDGRNDHEYFVPPIYDCQAPDGYFKTEERRLTDINHEIEALTQSERYVRGMETYHELVQAGQNEIGASREALKRHKQERDALRANGIGEAEEQELIRQSQFEKAEHKRLERKWQERINKARETTECLVAEINELKEMRRQKSAELQSWLFEQYRIRNARGEEKTVNEIFAESRGTVPPGGTGECAAPKLLQYAYLNHYEPVAMAEFWWGDSPAGEVRRHGHFYPACHNKCEPLLNFMLQGLNVEPNRLTESSNRPLEIVYEDEWIVAVNKPAGLLSVPGREAADSVYSRMRMLYPEATGPLVVHRLDMATSGVFLIAKTKEVHAALQRQFEQRKVQKRYIAIVNGRPTHDEGTIDIPIRLNPDDRPRQIVDYENGKSAQTHYKVLSTDGKTSRIEFCPLTGRTHQIRLHAAHEDGLNCYILGDNLYGKQGERLLLHAESILFAHPITKKTVKIEAKCKF